MQKQILPILIIIILVVMLLSTYAWFSVSRDSTGNIALEAGFPAQMSMSQQGMSPDEENRFTVQSLNADTYKGQAGFRLNDEGTQYVAYASNLADYRYILQANVGYFAASKGNAIFTLRISKVVVHLKDTRNRQWGELAQDLGIEQSAVEENKVNHIDNTENLKVEQIVFFGEYAERFFEFDYYKYEKPVNSEGGENPANAGEGGENPVSAKGTGILLEYQTDVCEAGKENFVTVKLGFYGLGTVNVTPTDGEQEVYCRPFVFAGSEFQETSFEFYFIAEVNNV